MAPVTRKTSLLRRLLPILIVVILVWYFWPSKEDDASGAGSAGSLFDESNSSSNLNGGDLAGSFFNWLYPDTGSAAANNTALSGEASSAPVYGTLSGTGGIFGQDKAISGLRDHYTAIRGGGRDVYTVMVYMIGTDLESSGGCATADLQEMLNSKCGGNVNLVIQTGGCKDWNNNLMTDRECQRWQIRDGKIGKLADLGKKSMVDPNTLTDFLKYCAKNFPADRYSVIFWDHGGGSMMGYGHDELYSSGSLMLSDIGGCLKASGIRYDFVGYDACLMGSIENAYMLEPYADYMIASEEVEPGWGWDYTNWLAKLTADPSADTVSIGQWIVDDFIAQNSASDTLSVVELREIPYLYKALGAYMANSSAELTSKSYSTLSRSRANAKAYGDGQYEMVDIVDLAYRSGIAGADELVEAIASAVKYRNNCTLSGSYGLSMYYPYTQLSYYSSTKKDISKFGYGGECTGFFDRFVNILAGGGRATANALGAAQQQEDYSAYDWYDPTVAQQYDYSGTAYDIREVVEKGDGYVLKMSDSDWDLIAGIELQAMQDDGEGYIDLGSDQMWEKDDDGDLLITFDNTWVSVEGQNVAFYAEREQEGVDGSWFSYGTSPAVLNGETAIDLVLCWSSDKPEGYVAGYRIASDTLTVATKGLIALQPGDTLDFVCDYYDYDGNFVDQYRLGVPITVGDSALLVSYEDVGTADVLVFYQLTDIYQNVFYTEGVRFTS